VGATFVIEIVVPVELRVSVGAFGVFGERSKFVRTNEPDALALPRGDAALDDALKDTVLSPLVPCVAVFVVLRRLIV
jgi:hypothetical protein